MTSAASDAPAGQFLVDGSDRAASHLELCAGRLSDVKTIRAALGGTVNDVVLTVVSGGLRDLLEARGERVADGRVRALVPVSVRRPDERASTTIACRRCSPSCRSALPIRRLDSRLCAPRWAASSSQNRPSQATCSPRFLVRSADAARARRAPRGTLSVVRRADRRDQRPRAPAAPETLGRRLLESFPFVPVIGQVRISIAIFSYDGGLYFGVTADYDSSSDIDILTRGVERSMAELLALVAPPPARRTQATRGKAAKAAKGDKRRA